MNSHFTTRLLPLPLFAALLAIQPLHAMAATVTVETAPFTPAVNDQSQPLATTMAQIMALIASSRSALQQKSQGQAQMALEQSQVMLDELVKHHGSGTLSLWISATHKTLSAHAEDTFWEPGRPELRRLDTAKDELRHGRLVSAENIVDSIDFPLVYAEMDMPLRRFQAGVSKALSLVRHGFLAAANLVLEETQLAANTDASLFGGDFSS